MLRAIPAHLSLALQVLQQQSLIVVVLRAGGKESPVKVGIVVRQSIDGHGVEQFLPPVGGAVLDVPLPRRPELQHAELALQKGICTHPLSTRTGRRHRERTTTTLHPFNGLFSGTTSVSRYQKVRQIWIYMRHEIMGFWDAVASAGPYANNLHLAPDR